MKRCCAKPDPVLVVFNRPKKPLWEWVFCLYCRKDVAWGRTKRIPVSLPLSN